MKTLAEKLIDYVNIFVDNQNARTGQVSTDYDDSEYFVELLVDYDKRDHVEAHGGTLTDVLIMTAITSVLVGEIAWSHLECVALEKEVNMGLRI
jgi:hypothetical protein